MSCNKSTKKSSGLEGFDFGSISNILSIISNAFKLPNIPSTPLPPPLVLIGGKLRNGMSSRDIASRIISRQSEAGAPVGDIFSESNNISEAMEVIRVEEILFALQNEARIDVAIPIGIPINGLGVGFMGFPVSVQGFTTQNASGVGIMT